jgi:hypothetical protein
MRCELGSNIKKANSTKSHVLSSSLGYDLYLLDEISNLGISRVWSWKNHHYNRLATAVVVVIINNN